jgi:hypothetical protein
MGRIYYPQSLHSHHPLLPFTINLLPTLPFDTQDKSNTHQSHPTLATTIKLASPKPWIPLPPPANGPLYPKPSSHPTANPSLGKSTHRPSSLISAQITLHCLPEHVEAYRHKFKYINLPEIIQNIRATTQPALGPTPFIFERTTAAATANTRILEQHHFNTEKATQTRPNTVLTYGSEFKATTTLAPLLSQHHHWPKIRTIIDKGLSYPLEAIDEETRLSDIEHMLQRGNHKSALEPDGIAALDKAFSKEVRYQWAIPILPTCIKKIPGASVTPLGVATQWSINAKNERIIKRRTTHDCTFPGPSGLSCNNRVIKELVDECTYGHAFRRFLHGIHAMRRRHPHTSIFINKTDMDAAYRRIHTNIQAAVTCITVVHDIAYLLVRVPFGASPAPSGFSLVSDAAGDLAQDLALDPNWDPAKLHSSFDLDFIPQLEAPSVPFGQADELSINLPPREIVTDNFIDDLFQAALHKDDNAERIKHAVPLVLETLFRQLDHNDDCPRDAIINLTKHEAEGRLEETKTILGWVVDSRRFRVRLTPEKAADWVRDIDTMITAKSCSAKSLESTIGRLNHTSIIAHIGRYFLTRLRYRLHLGQRTGPHHSIKLAEWDVKDLQLWRFIILHLSKTGSSINNICFTKPSAITYSDACEWGLGGVTMQGLAWRWLIPSHLRRRASINYLEFMAAIITVELSITYDSHASTHPHILAFTDNSSALGWMYHSTFNPVQHRHHDDMARHLARLLFNTESTLHAEHIPGDNNVVADSLSRDFHLTNSQLTSLLTTHAPPQQVPPTFQIRKLPRKISSWASSRLELLPQTKGSEVRPAPSSLAALQSSKPSSTPAASKTHSSPSTLTPSANSSCQHSPTATGSIGIAQPPKHSSWAHQSKAPYPMWFRPSGKTFGLIPPETPTERKVHCSTDSSAHTGMATLPADAKPASP